MNLITVDINGTPHKADGVVVDFKVFAKWLDNRFFVLASGEGDLFDPLNSSNNVHKKDKERGGVFWKLVACSQECYQQYTTFLRSKNRTSYIVAQRRFRNDSK